MATIDERTTRLNLPLPVKTNALKDDCDRLRETISTLDTKVATVGNDGKIPLAGDGYDGQRVTFVKLGGASSNIQCAKLINGATNYPMTTAYSAVTLMFSAELDTWLVLSKS